MVLLGQLAAVDPCVAFDSKAVKALFANQVCASRGKRELGPTKNATHECKNVKKKVILIAKMQAARREN